MGNEVNFNLISKGAEQKWLRKIITPFMTSENGL